MIITLNKLSMTPWPRLLSKRMASAHFVKCSDTVRTKRFPFLNVRDIGLTTLLATWHHEEYTGIR